jgi:hypothetical protein
LLSTLLPSHLPPSPSAHPHSCTLHCCNSSNMTRLNITSQVKLRESGSNLLADGGQGPSSPSAAAPAVPAHPAQPPHLMQALMPTAGHRVGLCHCDPWVYACILLAASNRFRHSWMAGEEHS